MRYVTDTPTAFCPECGEPSTWSTAAVKEFTAGAAHTCDCGAEFQHVPAEAIRTVANKHGDAGQYWS
jgi:transcription elongation factor Elf1